ncbi:hypothetical protein J8273_7911 [Carpediemonas membranifera]|uniref:Uncharacterized protein n=1 Tax=Carpediemonas membranifera TaxID=201153 RepID=A0A8J6ARQ7_9EUKA|nr:hypothetical protein J8273_7911 [Carpediemonas membranifera]|eukprot:KAG9390560.1 hypothetical protein J8273_7911 [Carpediemonas membranifera]
MGVLGLTKEAKRFSSRLILGNDVVILLDWPSIVFEYLNGVAIRSGHATYPTFSYVELLDGLRNMLASLKRLPVDRVIVVDDGAHSHAKGPEGRRRREEKANSSISDWRLGLDARGRPVPFKADNLGHPMFFPANSLLKEHAEALCLEVGIEYDVDIVQEADSRICSLCYSDEAARTRFLVASNDSDMHLVSSMVHVLAPISQLFHVTRETTAFSTLSFMPYLAREAITAKDPLPVPVYVRAAIAACLTGNDYSKHLFPARGPQRHFMDVFRSLTGSGWLDAVRAVEGMEQAVRDTIMVNCQPCPRDLMTAGPRPRLPNARALHDWLSPELRAQFGRDVLSHAKFHPTVMAVARTIEDHAPGDGAMLSDVPALYYADRIHGKDGEAPTRETVVASFAKASERLQQRFTHFGGAEFDRGQLFVQDLAWGPNCPAVRDAILGLVVTAHLTQHESMLGWIWDALDFDVPDQYMLVAWVGVVAAVYHAIWQDCRAPPAQGTVRRMVDGLTAARPTVLERAGADPTEDQLTPALMRASDRAADRLVLTTLRGLSFAQRTLRYYFFEDPTLSFNQLAAVIDSVAARHGQQGTI